MCRENRSGLLVFLSAVTAMLFIFPMVSGAEASSTAAGSRQEDLVGTWVTVVNERELEMVLGADGSMTFVGNNWTYTTGPGKLYVNTGASTIDYDIQLSGDRLVISGGDIDGSLEFTRKGGGMTGGQQTQEPSILGPTQTQEQQQTGGQAPNLVGTWVTIFNGQEVEMVFNADGSMTFVGNNWTYTAAPGKLTVHTASGSVDYNLQFSGDSFTLSGGDIDGSAEFNRKSGGGMTGGQTQGGMFGKQQGGQQGTTGGGITPEALAGYWTAEYNGQTFELWFDEGGYMDFNEQTWSYTVSGNQLIVDTGTQKITYNISLSGDTLVISGGDTPGPITFTRSEY